MSNKQAGFATRAIHVGQEPDAETGAVSPPIHPTSTYVQQELGSTKDTNIPEVRTPPALGWNKTSPRWKAASPLRSSPAAWRQLTQFLQCTNRATTSCAATTFMVECRASSIRCWQISGSSSRT